MRWKSYLQVKTRDPRFLWRMVLGILAVGMAGAVVVQWLPLRSSEAPRMRFYAADSQFGGQGDPVESLESVLADPHVDFSALLDLLPLVWDGMDNEDKAENHGRLRDLLSTSGHLNGTERRIATALWSSLGYETPAPVLAALAEPEPPRRYANWAVGVFWQSIEHDDKAAAAFEREGRVGGNSNTSKKARRRAVQLYLAADDTGALQRLANDPLFSEEVDNVDVYATMQLAVRQHDWLTLWWAIPGVMLATAQDHPGPALIALLTGISWFVFSLQAGKAGVRPGFRVFGIPCRRTGNGHPEKTKNGSDPIVFATAVVLGMLSVWPTLMLVFVWKEAWGFAKYDTLADGLRFFILGVGLREELCKLLLFVPLAPWLVRRGNELEMLIAAACVGLGFALEENIGYFASSHSTASIPRYLTANFFHMAATGLCGLWLCRAIRWPRECGSHFLAMFGIIVFAHGLYDAFIAVPALQGYSIASMILFILLSQQFFHELRGLRKTTPETVSLMANFLLGVSLLTSITLIYVAAILGFQLALLACLMPAVSTGLMVYMFLREMPE